MIALRSSILFPFALLLILLLSQFSISHSLIIICLNKFHINSIFHNMLCFDGPRLTLSRDDGGGMCCVDVVISSSLRWIEELLRRSIHLLVYKEFSLKVDETLSVVLRSLFLLFPFVFLLYFTENSLFSSHS